MKYYKILDKEENHHGLQYKTGLNIDPIPFNPSGNCLKGGIYFSREHILCFLNYGCWIRGVTIPEGTPIYENPGIPKKFKAPQVILGRRRKITAKVVKQLINEGIDPKANDSQVLRDAVLNNNLEMVKLLIPVSDPKANDSQALREAVLKNNLEMVKLLIPVSDPKVNDSQALRNAVLNNNLEIVKLLIPVSDPKVKNSQALKNAVWKNNLEMVKLLIPVSDPKVGKELKLNN